MKVIYTFIVLVFILQFKRYAGEECVIKSTGSSGQCTSLFDCHAALKLVHSGILPEYCQTMPSFICCQQNVVTISTTMQPVVTSRTTEKIRRRTTDCIIKSTGSPGQCKSLFECPAALQSIRNGILLDYCETVPLHICCQNNMVTTSTTNKPVITTRIAGETSRQKCEEYTKEAEKLDPFVGPGIVGGVVANDTEYPHMALIGYQSGNEITYRCGGSMISENYILTAAHCLEDRELGAATTAAIGMTHSDDENRQTVKIVEIIYHPQYKYPSRYHDIGLMRMEGATINSLARPACLYTAFEIKHKTAVASGWGITGTYEDTSRDLLKVELEFFGPGKCNNTYKNDYGTRRLQNGIRDDVQLCAGSATSLRDTCQGDSGGPLQINHIDEKYSVKYMYDLVGITSFGRPCGIIKNAPGVYTRVSAYLQWIEDIVWPKKR